MNGLTLRLRSKRRRPLSALFPKIGMRLHVTEKMWYLRLQVSHHGPIWNLCENPTTRHLQVLTQSTVSGIGVSQQTQNPKNTETSTNVEATLFTTNKEGTNVM